MSNSNSLCTLCFQIVITTLCFQYFTVTSELETTRMCTYSVNLFDSCDNCT